MPYPEEHSKDSFATMYPKLFFSLKSIVVSLLLVLICYFLLEAKLIDTHEGKTLFAIIASLFGPLFVAIATWLARNEDKAISQKFISICGTQIVIFCGVANIFVKTSLNTENGPLLNICPHRCDSAPAPFCSKECRSKVGNPRCKNNCYTEAPLCERNCFAKTNQPSCTQGCYFGNAPKCEKDCGKNEASNKNCREVCYGNAPKCEKNCYGEFDQPNCKENCAGQAPKCKKGCAKQEGQTVDCDAACYGSPPSCRVCFQSSPACSDSCHAPYNLSCVDRCTGYAPKCRSICWGYLDQPECTESCFGNAPKCVQSCYGENNPECIEDCFGNSPKCKRECYTVKKPLSVDEATKKILKILSPNDD